MKKHAYFCLLTHKSFMSFWGATTLLRLASNLLQFAMAIYVLDLTGSGFVFSTVLSVIILPRIFCTSIAGYFADFKNPIQILRRGVLGAAVLMGGFWIIHVFILPLNVPLIYALVISLELCETFLAPTEGKLLLSIVSEEDVAPASKLSSLDDGIVEILSPILATFVYGWMGLSSILGVMFLLEGIAFLMTLWIRTIHSPVPAAREQNKAELISLKHIFGTYRDAVISLKKRPYVIGIILFAPLFNFFLNPLFSVTAPHYFRVTMHSGVELYAVFNTVLGLAGVIAPFCAMAFIRDKDEYRVNQIGILSSAAVLLVLIGILCYGGHLAANTAMYAVTGAMALLVGLITVMNIAVSIAIKRRIPEHMLGRVISVIQLFATISVPLGQLVYGVCADRFSLPTSYLLSVFGLGLTFVVMVQTYRASEKK